MYQNTLYSRGLVCDGRAAVIRASVLLLGLLVGSPSARAQFLGTDFTTGTADGATANVLGSAAVGPNASAAGTNATAVGLNSIAGTSAVNPTTNNDSAFGVSATATGGESTAIGASTQATARAASAFGINAHATGDSSIAIGSNSVASGAGASAIGPGSLASGLISSAYGDNAHATGSRSMAMGPFSTASGISSTASGDTATASGLNSSAYGFQSTASAANSAAFGSGATAGFINSTAIGTGAVTTRDNQQVFGNTTNTYTTPGITSAASKAAQVGPTQLVTSDAGGNLATTDPSAVVAGTAAFQGLQTQVTRADEGVAMAMSMAGSGGVLPECTNYAISANWGNFEGQNAVTFGGIARLKDNIFLNGGVGVGTNQGTVGGRFGVTYAW